MSFRIGRVDPVVEPALGIDAWDYADAFEVVLDQPDHHLAEQWLRAGLAEAPKRITGLVRLILRHIVRFDLDGDDPTAFLGWRPLVSEHDVAAIEADGPLTRAVLVARRHSPTRCRTSTYLFFHNRVAARLMWMGVRPIHLRAERYLLAGAARTLIRDHSKAVASR